ncbi:MAG: hypothetical protein PHV02_18695 [Rhodocyclaceae bacterium]|nr:hypothetical protein [Rhodocyclaceae bacterium]
MITPAHSLRVVFALGTFACSVILVLFVHGRAQWTPEFWLQLLATAIGICSAACFIAFRQGKMRVEGVPLGRFVGVFLRQLVLAYVASAVVVTAIALVFIYLVTRTAPNALALAVLAGLWLSLWITPVIASISSWRKLRPTIGNGA